MLFGRSASVAGRVVASFMQGIWMMSFFTDTSLPSSRYQLLYHAIPGDGPRPIVPCVAQGRRARLVARERADGAGDGRLIGRHRRPALTFAHDLVPPAR